ncbi:MAG: hypothetical protein M3O50_10900 [Myxococcota bacterium]|nr:hypothetical protein [Myxococcota bacterium]
MRHLAAALELARTSRSRIAKEEAIACALASIARDENAAALAMAARLAAGRTLAVGDGRTLGVGWSLVLDLVCDATGFDAEVVVACARKTGDLGEAFGLLARRAPGAHDRVGLRLEAVGRLADALASEGSRAGKRALLDAAFAVATPLETKYLCKALGGGLRIGAQDGVVEGAISRAFGAPLESVRRAAALVTDLGALAVLAHQRRLGEARLLIGRPLAFMLATPIESLAIVIDPAAYVLEDKLDGVRAQAHRTAAGSVAIFARGLDRLTDAFPEIVSALTGAHGPAVLDGEIIAIAPSGRPRPFQALQPRLKKSPPSADELTQARVALVVFDLLADASGPLLGLPWSERRKRLESLLEGIGPHDTLRLNAATAIPTGLPVEGALEAAFVAARARGHEGLVLKRADAPYEAGRRGHAWIKVKRAHATLDVVVVAAEEGHGSRAGVLSDYTFAVWRGEELVPVGKAYSGLSDVELEATSRRLDGLTTERRGGLRLVRPEIVIEVAFDGIQRSARHSSGFALRFPRIVRLRDDKAPELADRVAAVEALFAAQVASGHRESEEPLRKRGLRRPLATRRGDAPQLSLFDDED